MITKGELFDAVEIVSERSAAGSWAVHVPHELTWALEHADDPAEAPRFRRLRHLGELTGLVADLA